MNRGKQVVHNVGLSREAAEVIISQLADNHQHFTVTFQKANGETREATCMMGVKKTYNGKDAGNIGIWERLRDEKGRFVKGQYRAVKKERIVSIKTGYVKYFFG